jgi:hypothetical protein
VESSTTLTANGRSLFSGQLSNYLCLTLRVEGGVTYTQTFDAEHQPTSVQTVTAFVFDGDGQRTGATGPARHHLGGVPGRADGSGERLPPLPLCSYQGRQSLDR